MSTQSEGEPTTSEPAEEEKPVGKIYYCEICEVPCMSSMTLQTHFAGIRHKKRERALKGPREPVIYEYEDPEPERKPLPINIRSLKDYLKDPCRKEPLVGLEYVIEIRFKGRKEPSYECQLCEFGTEMVPMIEHLTGQRHRKLYLRKHHPGKIKRMPNEEKALFLKRAARMIEKEEGLKNYKCESFERYCAPSTTARKKKKVLNKPINNGVRKRNALLYMDHFEITSDAEATLVVNLAQYLSEELKVFCEKRATIVHMRSLPPLMKKGKKNSKQASKCQPTNQAFQYEQYGPTGQASQYRPTGQASQYRPTGQASQYGPTSQASQYGPTGQASQYGPTSQASQYGPTSQASQYKPTNQASQYKPTNQASQYKPTKPFENYQQGNTNQDQGDTNQDLGIKNWSLGQLSNGVAQLKSLLRQTSSISHTPTESYGSQMGRGVPSSVISSKDRATMSALQSSFALQPGDAGCGIEWMKQFNQSASVCGPSTSAGTKPPYFTSPQGSYPTQHQQGNSNNRMPVSGIKPWSSMTDSLDSKTHPLTPVSYPVPRGYQANYPSQRFPSTSGNDMPASFSSERSSTGWPQQSGYQQSNIRKDVASYPSVSGNSSCPNYQQQNTQLNTFISGSNSGLSADIMSQLRGKDAATLTGMLQQLVPHYPDLQKIDIRALAQALSQMS